METMKQTKIDMAQKYDLLASKFQHEYEAGKERGNNAMIMAMDKAREQLVEAGEFSNAQGHELKQYLSRDLDQTIVDMEQLGEAAKEKLHPSRLGAGALASLAAVLSTAEHALHSISAKTKEKLSYKTGEITSAGTLTCLACGQKVKLKTSGHVPPCPKCKGTKFNKGY